MRPLSEKKIEETSSMVLTPMEKKEKWGYADAEGKFVIRPAFEEVMPMSSKMVAFVSYVNEAGKKVWTLLDYTRIYPTELEFDEIVADFDEKGLAVVVKDSLYGIVNHTGKMLAECAYTTYLNRGSVFLLRNSHEPEWIVVSEDASEDGATSYRFADNEPIVVKSINGYGIISPRDRSIVAEFVHDSMEVFIPGSIYCLQKGSEKYLYADDRMSEGYEDIIPGVDNAYFVIKQNGLYGVLTPKHECLLACSQTEIPVLKKDEFIRYYVNGEPVYVKVDAKVTAEEFDNHLYAKYAGRPADYLLDDSLDFAFKQYVSEAIYNTYGTPDFDRIVCIPQAVAYANSRRFILLSSDILPAKYLDLETGLLRDAGEIVYHAFPSRNGVPTYASVLKDGKFGIIDIRNHATVLPFEYDAITPIGNGYVLLQVAGDAPQVHLYNVTSGVFVLPNACESASTDFIAWDLVSLRQRGRENLYNIKEHSWLLPDDHKLVSYVRLPQTEASALDMAAFMKKDSKGALFSLTTGERLTDYLFDDVAKELVEGKYHLVSVGKKLGLYDLASKKYYLACNYDRIENLHYHFGNVYVVVSRDKKYGVYNISKDKLVVPIKSDAIDLKGGYARLKQGKTYKIFSFKKNDVISIDIPFEHIELLEDGYALMFTSSASGVYDMNRNKWQFSFGARTKKDFGTGEFNDLGDNLLFIPGFGVLNYLTCKWQIRANLGWANWSNNTGDFVEIRGGTAGQTKAIYSLKRSKMILNYNKTYQMYPIVDAQNLKKDYIIFHSYGKQAKGAQSGEYKSPSWLPWNDAEGGAGLLDVDAKKWLFADEDGMSYLTAGLLYVVNKGLYDLNLGAWAMNSNAKFDYFKEGGNLYIEAVGQDGNTIRYWFDPQARALVPVSETFSIYDYQALEKVMEVENYSPKVLGTQWRLYDYQNNSYIQHGYDRISLMFE